MKKAEKSKAIASEVCIRRGGVMVANGGMRGEGMSVLVRVDETSGFIFICSLGNLFLDARSRAEELVSPR